MLAERKAVMAAVGGLAAGASRAWRWGSSRPGAGAGAGPAGAVALVVAKAVATTSASGMVPRADCIAALN
eukprot:7246636-Alexandrium_andersonii.AAC.1